MLFGDPSIELFSLAGIDNKCLVISVNDPVLYAAHYNLFKQRPGIADFFQNIMHPGITEFPATSTQRRLIDRESANFYL